MKYWGKQPGTANIPATPSLSITLDAIATRTRVEAATEDRVFINGSAVPDAKVLALIAQMREVWQLPPLVVHSANDFPTGAGLASSASGCAALVTAIDHAFGLNLTRAERSMWARRGVGFRGAICLRRLRDAGSESGLGGNAAVEQGCLAA